MFRAIILLGALATAGPAFAAQFCAERDTIVDRLAQKYSESHQASGLQSATKMVELWTSSTTGSWTILITDAHGKTCIAAAGNSWLDMEDTAALPGQTG